MNWEQEYWTYIKNESGIKNVRFAEKLGVSSGRITQARTEDKPGPLTTNPEKLFLAMEVCRDFYNEDAEYRTWLIINNYYPELLRDIPFHLPRMANTEWKSLRLYVPNLDELDLLIENLAKGFEVLHRSSTYEAKCKRTLEIVLSRNGLGGHLQAIASELSLDENKVTNEKSLLSIAYKRIQQTCNKFLQQLCRTEFVLTDLDVRFPNSVHINDGWWALDDIGFRPSRKPHIAYFKGLEKNVDGEEVPFDFTKGPSYTAETLGEINAIGNGKQRAGQDSGGIKVLDFAIHGNGNNLATLILEQNINHGWLMTLELPEKYQGAPIRLVDGGRNAWVDVDYDVVVQGAWPYDDADVGYYLKDLRLFVGEIKDDK